LSTIIFVLYSAFENDENENEKCCASSGVNRESQFLFLSLFVLAQRSKNQKRVHTLLSLSLSLSSKRNNNGGEREGERERLLREKREERRKEFLLSFVSFFLKDEMFEKKKNRGLCRDRGQK